MRLLGAKPPLWYRKAVSLNILYIGEVVGRAGIFALKKLLPGLKAELRPDLTIACANGTTGGAGLGKAHSVYLRKLGLDALTLGEAAFWKKDIVEAFPKQPWMLRPANHPPGVPGRGWRVFQTPHGRVALIQLLGQAGFGRTHLDNPFQAVDELVPRLAAESDAVVLEFRAATTAEKIAMARHADGRVSAVFGSYGRAITADARISPAGTAAITDAGRTGSILSVGGMDPETRIGEYLSGVPAWAHDAVDGIELQGCAVELADDGKANSIRPFRLSCKEVFHERAGSGD